MEEGTSGLEKDKETRLRHVKLNLKEGEEEAGRGLWVENCLEWEWASEDEMKGRGGGKGKGRKRTSGDRRVGGTEGERNGTVHEEEEEEKGM